MKKIIALLLALTVAFALTGCGGGESYEIEIIIPAGSTEAFVYSDEEISPTRDTITISAGAGISDTEVALKPVEASGENACEPTYLTHGMPVKMDAEKGAWFKIGVAIQNPSDHAIAVAVEVSNVVVRIE